MHDHDALGFPCLVCKFGANAPDRVRRCPLRISIIAQVPQRWEAVNGKFGGGLDVHVWLHGRLTHGAVQLKSARGHDMIGAAFGMKDMVVESWHHGEATADDSHTYFNDAEP